MKRLNITDPKLRQWVMAQAIKIAPIAQTLKWRWAVCGGTPGPEDIADEILRQLSEHWLEHRSHSYSSCGNLAVRVSPDEEIDLLIVIDTLYVGEDDEPEDATP